MTELSTIAALSRCPFRGPAWGAGECSTSSLSRRLIVSHWARRGCDFPVDVSTARDPHNFHGLRHRIAYTSDMEPELYQHCCNNHTSMGNWFAPLVRAHAAVDNPVLKLPKTRIMRLGQELAQTLWLEFHETNQLSRDILDRYFFESFQLDKDTDYFIKTDTFSGKFQFANAHCTEPDEIAQYFQVINNFAMVVGAGESVDLAVRDYIAPEPGTPEIYNGMPLRCEYRIFVDLGGNDTAKTAISRM